MRKDEMNGYISMNYSQLISINTVIKKREEDGMNLTKILLFKPVKSYYSINFDRIYGIYIIS